MYWERDGGEGEYREDGRQWGTCGLAESVKGEAAVPGTFVVARDTEGYHASLFTTHNYGCVSWEVRKP